MGSFDTGFNFGMSAYNNAMLSKERALDRARQEKLDASAADLQALQKQKIESDLARQKQSDIDEQELRDTSDTSTRNVTSLKFGESTSSDTTPEAAAQSLDAIHLANKSLPNDQQIHVPQAENAVAVGRGSSGRRFAPDPAGLTDAKSYADSLKDPIAAIQRRVDVLRKQGKDTEANVLELGAVEQKNKLYAANLSALRRTVLSELSNNGPGAVVDMYSKYYGDGLSAEFVPGQDGGGSIVRRKGDKVVDKITFGSTNELAGKLDDLLDPEKGLQRYRDQETKKAEAAAKEKERQEALLAQMKLIDYRERLKSTGGGVGSGGGSGGAGGNPTQADATHGFDEKGALSYARKMVEDEIKGDPANMIEPKPMTDAQAAKRVYDTRDAMRAEHVARSQADLKQQMLIGSIRQAKTPQQLAQVVSQAQKLKYSKAEIDAIIAKYSPLVAE